MRTKKDIINQIKTTLQLLESMTADEKKKEPHAHYINEYASVWDATFEIADADKCKPPPRLEVSEGQFDSFLNNDDKTKAHFIELRDYYSRLETILSEQGSDEN